MSQKEIEESDFKIYLASSGSSKKDQMLRLPRPASGTQCGALLLGGKR